MAEIKSTLDLVMERTRHMSLSAEEKTQQKRSGFKKRIQGLLNKYIDEALPADVIKDQIEALQAEMKVPERQLVSEAIFTHIDPDKNNKPWFNLIDIFSSEALEPLKKITKEYQKQQADQLKSAKQRLLDQLAENYGIKGSAVLPNIEKNIQYQKIRDALKLEAQTKIEAIPR
jgi:transcriptional regulatory protein LevR